MTFRKVLAAGLGALLMAASTPAFADVQYVYDSSGRLIKAIYSNGVTIEYRYDAAGNRTQIVSTNIPNTPPDAINDASAVDASSSVNVMVRTNDTDAQNNTLSVIGVGAPTGGGSVSIQSGGAYVRYTAPATSGLKSFTYTISDGAGGTDTATVNVTVSSVNFAPVAIDDDNIGITVGTSQSIFVTGNDTDDNQDSLTVTGYSNVSGGVVSIPAGGTYVVYAAPASPGTYTFNYTVSDGNGGSDVGLVTVTVELGEQCDPQTQGCF